MILEQNPKYSASHQNQEIMGSINSELTLGKSSHAGGGLSSSNPCSQRNVVAILNNRKQS
jgi:hypothetical protein